MFEFALQEVTWETLKKVNGMLDHYILRAKSVDQNENLLAQRNFCKESELFFNGFCFSF
jgi:hypothetical protein